MCIVLLDGEVDDWCILLGWVLHCGEVLQWGYRRTTIGQALWRHTAGHRRAR